MQYSSVAFIVFNFGTIVETRSRPWGQPSRDLRCLYKKEGQQPPRKQLRAWSTVAGGSGLQQRLLE